MEKFAWDEDFEWLELDPMADEDYLALSNEEIVNREIKLAIFLEAYLGRWVLIKNSAVVTSGNTLQEVNERGLDHHYIHLVPENNEGGFLFSQAV